MERIAKTDVSSVLDAILKRREQSMKDLKKEEAEEAYQKMNIYQKWVQDEVDEIMENKDKVDEMDLKCRVFYVRRCCLEIMKDANEWYVEHSGIPRRYLSEFMKGGEGRLEPGSLRAILSENSIIGFTGTIDIEAEKHATEHLFSYRLGKDKLRLRKIDTNWTAGYITKNVGFCTDAVSYTNTQSNDRDRFFETNFLVLLRVGSENKAKRQAVDHLIVRRADNGLFTVFTTNLNFEQLDGHYSPALAKRISEYGLIT